MALTLAHRPLLALVSLRWQMIRDRRTRRQVAVLALVPALLMSLAVAGGLAVPADRRPFISVLLPTIAVGTVLVSVIAPLVAGGGNELYPRDQLVAFPITARAVYYGSLLLAPLNVAWMLQLTVLLAATAVTVGAGPGLALSLVSMLLFTMVATVVGQTIAWAVAGIRVTHRGRLWTRAGFGVLIGAVVVVVVSGSAAEVLDNRISRVIVNVAFDGAGRAWGAWTTATLAMIVAVIVTARLGVAAVHWGQRRPGWSGYASGSPARGRSSVRSAADAGGTPGLRSELLAVDRASVWRSPALRRGVLVLAVLPGAAAALAGLEWRSLSLLPTLTAAAAGLLFGVNAFALDGGGAAWLGSLPRWGRAAFWAKTWVVTETCLAASAIAIIGGALRAPAPGSATEVVAVFSALAAGSSVVVAMVIRLSVRNPHRATLDGPRDAPAPPGTMAGYSLRLAVPCTVVGLAFAAVSTVSSWWFPLVLSVPFVCWSIASVLATAREWEDPVVQATVLSRVSAG